MNGSSLDFFNFKIKQAFIDDLRTRNGFKYNYAESAFKKVAQLEHKKQADLYKIGKLTILKHISDMSLESAYVYVNIYNLYKAWASDKYEGVKNEKITRNDVRKFINPYENNKFLNGTFSYKTLLELENRCEYKQNALHLVLAFEGILGCRDNKDIFDLRITDMDFPSSIVSLPDRGSPLKISKRVCKYIEEACKETKGKNYNSNTGKVVDVEYLDTGYVYKCTKRAKSSDLKVTKASLNLRNDYIKFKYPDIFNGQTITAKKAKNSGMLFYLSMMEKYFAEPITNEIVFKVVKRYGGTYSLVSPLKTAYDLYRVKYVKEIKAINLSEEIVEVLQDIQSIGLTTQDYTDLKGVISNLKQKNNINNRKQKTEGFEYTDDFDSDWASELKRRGTKGEKYVIEAIKKYNKKIVINKVLDKYGFDLLIDDPYTMLEIKTTTKQSMGIHLSETEIQRGLNNHSYKIVAIITENFTEADIEAVVINEPGEILVQAQEILNASKKAFKKFDFSTDSVCVRLSQDYIDKQQCFKDFLKSLIVNYKR